MSLERRVIYCNILWLFWSNREKRFLSICTRRKWYKNIQWIFMSRKSIKKASTGLWWGWIFHERRGCSAVVAGFVCWRRIRLNRWLISNSSIKALACYSIEKINALALSWCLFLNDEVVGMHRTIADCSHHHYWNKNIQPVKRVLSCDCKQNKCYFRKRDISLVIKRSYDNHRYVKQNSIKSSLISDVQRNLIWMFNQVI